MPIQAGPNRGYADYQRVTNYDTQLLYNVTGYAASNTTSSGVLDVSRFDYLSGLVGVGATDTVVDLKWFADSGQVTALAHRVWVMPHNIINGAQLHVPNAGPYLVATFTSIGGGNLQLSAHLAASNRFASVDFLVTGAAVINSQNFVNPAATITRVYPTEYFTGPVGIYCLQNQPGSVFAEYIDAAGTWNQFWQVPLATSVDTYNVVIVPTGGWRIGVSNPGAVVAGAYLVAMPTTTGGS